MSKQHIVVFGTIILSSVLVAWLLVSGLVMGLNYAGYQSIISLGSWLITLIVGNFVFFGAWFVFYFSYLGSSTVGAIWGKGQKTDWRGSYHNWTKNMTVFSFSYVSSIIFAVLYVIYSACVVGALLRNSGSTGYFGWRPENDASYTGGYNLDTLRDDEAQAAFLSCSTFAILEAYLVSLHAIYTYHGISLRKSETKNA